MLKQIFGILTGALAFAVLPGCGKDCEPTSLPQDDIVYLNITKPGGGSYIKYTGNNLPADSVRITNLASGAAVSRSLIRDSILVIGEYNKTNSAVTNLKIEIGAAGVRKPDTLQITVIRKTEMDNCDRDFEVARFSSLKINAAPTLCTGGCTYNTVQNFVKP